MNDNECTCVEELDTCPTHASAVRLKASGIREWTYERPQGDIVVWAETPEAALNSIRECGFTSLDYRRLRQTA